MTVFNLELFKTSEGAKSLKTKKSEYANMPKITNNVRILLIAPLLTVILLNLLSVFLFMNDEKLLFNIFGDFGLRGSWNLFTLNLYQNINGTLKSYAFANTTFDDFLMFTLFNVCMFGIFMGMLCIKIRQLQSELAKNSSKPT